MSKEQNDKIALFQDAQIRKVSFDGEWYFVVEDVVMAITDSVDVTSYIKKMRSRDEELSKGWGQIVTPLPIATAGGRQSKNCANTEGVLRIIQSIPSKKAEPFKRWLARVGKERLDEIEQPGKAIERAKQYYLAKGHSTEWVQTRSASIDTRHTFTDKLKESGIKEGYQYAILTNELYCSSFGFTAPEYKHHKGLSKNDSLRDNMTPLELAAVIFSEATSTEIIQKTGAKDFIETKEAVHIAGSITKEAIEKIEQTTGKKVVTHENHKALETLEIRNELIQQSLPRKLMITETIKPLLSTSLNRKDEEPNIALAQEIAATSNLNAILELIELLSDKDKGIQSDSIKVLYEVAERKPELISEHTQVLLNLLSSKNNRLVWGAMTALNHITALNPARIFAQLPVILIASDSGSVIVKDHAIGILVKLMTVKEYSSDAFILLMDQLRISAPNQLPMYAEMALPVISRDQVEDFVKILQSRIPDIEKESKQKRVVKVISKALKLL